MLEKWLTHLSLSVVIVFAQWPTTNILKNKHNNIWPKMAPKKCDYPKCWTTVTHFTRTSTSVRALKLMQLGTSSSYYFIFGILAALYHRWVWLNEQNIQGLGKPRKLGRMACQRQSWPPPILPKLVLLDLLVNPQVWTKMKPKPI